MTNIPDITPLVHAFLQEHPEWLPQVYYLRVADSDEPQMAFTFDVSHAFLRWAQAHPDLTQAPPGRIQALLAGWDRIAREHGRP